MHSLFNFTVALTDPSNLTIALGSACLAYGVWGLRWARRRMESRL